VFTHLMVFTCGKVGSERVYSLSVIPEAAPDAEAPERKFVSRINPSSEVVGVKASVKPQLRHISFAPPVLVKGVLSVAFRKR